jgi:hypothetical protein
MENILKIKTFLIKKEKNRSDEEKRREKIRTRSDVSFFDKFSTPNKQGGSFENCL